MASSTNHVTAHQGDDILGGSAKRAHVTLIQYETRANPRRQALLAENRRYCHRHGYEYLNISNISDLPPQWMKVSLALLVLRAAQDGGIVCWLDSDAVIVDKNRKIEDVMATFGGSGEVFLAGGSSGGLLGAPQFNSSVFFIRTGDVARQLLEDWMDLYTPKNWIHAGTSWRLSVGSGTEKDLPGGAFVEGILPRYNKHVKLVESDIFNCVTPNFADVRARVFACHFHGPYQTRIQDYLISGGTGRGYERPVVGGDGLDIFSWRGGGLVLVGVALGGALIWGMREKVERSAPFLTAARNLSSHFQRSLQ
jgi:hypothetical protein